jgi:hypothetical protein
MASRAAASNWEVNLDDVLERGRQLDGVQQPAAALFMLLKWWPIKRDGDAEVLRGGAASGLELENNFSFVVEEVSLKFLFSKNIYHY